MAKEKKELRQTSKKMLAAQAKALLKELRAEDAKEKATSVRYDEQHMNV